MSIFNMITAGSGGGGGEGWKTSTFTTTAGTATLDSISFSVDAEPSEFWVFIFGPSMGNYYVGSSSTSRYDILNIHGGYDSLGSRTASCTAMRHGSGGPRLYYGGSCAGWSYTSSTNTVTISAKSTSYVFPSGRSGVSETFTYRMYYKV